MLPLIPDVVLGEPTHAVEVAQTEVAVRDEGEAIDATVSFALSTHSPTWVETDIPLAVPPGGQVYALVIEHPNETFHSSAEPIELAHDYFTTARLLPRDPETGRPRDPALLEQTDHGLVLHVFPISHDVPTTIRLFVRWPHNDGELHRRNWMAEDPAPHVPVDGKTALYAGPRIDPPGAHRHRGHIAEVPEPNLVFLERKR